MFWDVVVRLFRVGRGMRARGVRLETVELVDDVEFDEVAAFFIVGE